MFTDIFVFIFNIMKQKFINYCVAHLDFSVPDYGYYNSISLALLDTVLSPRANYEQLVIPTIHRFCDYVGSGLDNSSYSMVLPKNQQVRLSTVWDIIVSDTPESLANKLHNHQKIGGRLKTDSYCKCLSILHNHKIETYQDFWTRIDDSVIRTELTTNTGLRSSIEVFYMLCGDENNVNVSQHIREFVLNVTHANLSDDDIRNLIITTAEKIGRLVGLKVRLTPRHLDHIIWVYQRNQNQITND